MKINNPYARNVAPFAAGFIAQQLIRENVSFTTEAVVGPTGQRFDITVEVEHKDVLDKAHKEAREAEFDIA